VRICLDPDKVGGGFLCEIVSPPYYLNVMADRNDGKSDLKGVKNEGSKMRVLQRHREGPF